MTQKMPPTSTCEMIVNDNATPSSRTEASSIPEPSIRNYSSKQVCTKTSLMFGTQLDGATSFPLRSTVLGSSPSNFFALFGRWKTGFIFDFLGEEYLLSWKTFAGHLDFNKRWPISLHQTCRGFNRHEFWTGFQVKLSMASSHLGAVIFIIQLFSCCTSG